MLRTRATAGSTAVKTYLFVFAGLIALTALTFGLSFAELGALETPVALGIAGVKAGLVLGFFMHLVEHRRPYWIFLLVAVLLMTSLVALMALDVEKREPRRAPAMARPE